ncbi:hypothetical protein P280DRAFT_311695 [Massarina eburnea CBS 473.64]|uniref:Uncharacterized protein n=1 Tax=Massarina eburnea CBS 473.64 TaxID=1395130 RepID=A0A6A6S5E4_9PLEO|nr:hypothetical protein P280DRAFT_311695 [Massarina eburnea CBS 473.64]
MNQPRNAQPSVAHQTICAERRPKSLGRPSVERDTLMSLTGTKVMSVLGFQPRKRKKKREDTVEGRKRHGSYVYENEMQQPPALLSNKKRRLAVTTTPDPCDASTRRRRCVSCAIARRGPSGENRNLTILNRKHNVRSDDSWNSVISLGPRTVPSTLSPWVLIGSVFESIGSGAIGVEGLCCVWRGL